MLKSVIEAGEHPDPREATLLSDMARYLPNLVLLLPALFSDKKDVQQTACLSDMLSELHNVAAALNQAGYVSLS